MASVDVILLHKQGIAKAYLHYGGPLPMQEAHWGPVLKLEHDLWHSSFLSIFIPDTRSQGDRLITQLGEQE
jgi:hypothetical protein